MALFSGLGSTPGVQAIGLTAPYLPPVPGKAPTVDRDYEYVRLEKVRLGACSISQYINGTNY
ncbi:hypothetical protein [Methylomonas sp. HYX-M1]|uniref:hypothetical protein n=1 Tax=Methylomonas sp. HYX-M1 TaxID=3139307 RepID=UPI00345C502C